jgi:hypothetical protein
MHAKDVYTPEYLRQILSYDPETGRITWKFRSEEFYAEGEQPAARAKAFNTRCGGQHADERLNDSGYRLVLHKKVHMRAHRVAYALFHGKLTPGQVDLLNCDRTDNRLENLRVVSQAGNSRNMKRKSTNTSGHTGVSYVPRLNLWRSRACVNGKTIDCGLHKCPTAAYFARAKEHKKYGFHENHGRAT